MAEIGMKKQGTIKSCM